MNYRDQKFATIKILTTAILNKLTRCFYLFIFMFEMFYPYLVFKNKFVCYKIYRTPCIYFILIVGMTPQNQIHAHRHSLLEKCSIFIFQSQIQIYNSLLKISFVLKLNSNINTIILLIHLQECNESFRTIRKWGARSIRSSRKCYSFTRRWSSKRGSRATKSKTARDKLAVKNSFSEGLLIDDIKTLSEMLGVRYDKTVKQAKTGRSLRSFTIFRIERLLSLVRSILYSQVI